MNNMNEVAEEQQRQWVVEALEIKGFDHFDGDIYINDSGEQKVVVDIGKCDVYFHIDNEKIIDDDETGTLDSVRAMIKDARTGQMPSKSEPDIVVPPRNSGMCEQSQAPYNQTPYNQTPCEIVHSTAPPAMLKPQGMMLKNIIPLLKEIGAIKIGKKGEVRTSQKTGTEYRLPEKFDHFEVVSKHRDEHGDFIPDAPIMNLIGDNAKELNITLLYNDPTLNFTTSMNMYKGGKCLCRGDAETATTEDGTQKACNPDTCVNFQTKKCKPNGILSVVLSDAPRLGGVYKFRTTSINSIRSILSSMFYIQSLTGGMLASIPLKMTVSPQTVNPIDSPTAQTIYVVNIEFAGTMDDLQERVVQITSQRVNMQQKIAELEIQAKANMAIPESTEEIEDIEAEFYPDNSKE